MKTKRVPFDINKAKSGAKVVTRCGYPVRMSDFDVKNKDGYKLLGIIDIKGNEVPFSFMETGRRGGTETQSEYDLFIEEEVEPMFKVGDWIVQENAGVYKVTEICESWYEVIDFNEWHYSISFDQEPMCHLWNINDAKDGDVLVNGSNIFIFHFINDTRIMGYCHVNTYDDGFYIDLGKNDGVCLIDGVVTPATKEQCDLLFQRMKETGYMWDSDKKELHKIVPKFKVGDKVVLKSNKSLVGSIMLVSFIGTYCIRFKDFNAGWYSEQELEPYEMIEKETKTHRMTNQELAWWLRDHPEEHREFRYAGDKDVYNTYDYPENEANTPVKSILIRRNGGEWEEPLIEE